MAMFINFHQYLRWGLPKPRFTVGIWMFPKIGVPQNGWFIMETLLKWMIWGYHDFRKHPYILFTFLIHLLNGGTLGASFGFQQIKMFPAIAPHRPGPPRFLLAGPIWALDFRGTWCHPCRWKCWDRSYFTYFKMVGIFRDITYTDPNLWFILTSNKTSKWQFSRVTFLGWWVHVTPFKGWKCDNRGFFIWFLTSYHVRDFSHQRYHLYSLGDP